MPIAERTCAVLIGLAFYAGCCPPPRADGGSHPATTGLEAPVCPATEADAGTAPEAAIAEGVHAAPDASAGDARTDVGGAIPIEESDVCRTADCAWGYSAYIHVPFARRSTELDAEAFHVLIMLAAVLRTYPQYELIELQGIAMDGGTRAEAVALSRVERVRYWLYFLGVESSRIRYRVFGDRCDAQATGPAEGRQVRILPVRFDGHDTSIDPFGDCGPDGGASDVPAIPFEPR